MTTMKLTAKFVKSSEETTDHDNTSTTIKTKMTKKSLTSAVPQNLKFAWPSSS